MRSSSARVVTLAAVLPVLLVAGCGGDASTPSGSGSSSSSPTASSAASSPGEGSATASPSPAQGQVIDVTVEGDTVTPNGERLHAKVGEPVTLHVDANRPGELHVHSTPEQELDYKSGRTTLEVTIDKPGIVDIEDHVADIVIVQLEVG